MTASRYRIFVCLILAGFGCQFGIRPVIAQTPKTEQAAPALQSAEETYRQGLKLVKLGAPARRLIQLPLLAQARRWKSQHSSDDLDALRAKIAAIPEAFEALLHEYESAAAPSAPGGGMA